MVSSVFQLNFWSQIISVITTQPVSSSESENHGTIHIQRRKTSRHHMDSKFYGASWRNVAENHGIFVNQGYFENGQSFQEVLQTFSGSKSLVLLCDGTF